VKLMFEPMPEPPHSDLLSEAVSEGSPAGWATRRGDMKEHMILTLPRIPQNLLRRVTNSLWFRVHLGRAR